MPVPLRSVPFVMLVIILVVTGCQAGAVSPPTATLAPTATPTPVPPAATPTIPPEPTATLEPVELLWYSYYGGSAHAQWDRATADRYQERHPEVRLRYLSTALYSAPVPLDDLAEQMTHDRPPDVFSGFIGGGSLTRYARAGALMDVSDLWEAQGWYDMYPESITTLATVDGKQYFVPQAVQWNPVWYRTDVFDEVGVSPPESWDELLRLCEQLADAGYIPFTVSTVNWNAPVARWFTILNLRLNGPDYHDRLMRGEESFDDPRVRAVFEHWQQLFEHDCFDERQVNYRQAVRQLADGEAAMYNLGEWLFESTEPETEANLDFFRFPVIDPEVENGEIASVYGSYIHSDTAHPDAARELLTYLGSAGVQQSIVEDVGRLVATRAVEQEIYPAYQQKGLQFVEESERLTILYEFNAFDATLARESLRQFVRFFADWENPEQIASVMSALEEERQAALGE